MSGGDDGVVIFDGDDADDDWDDNRLLPGVVERDRDCNCSGCGGAYMIVPCVDCP